MLRIVALNLLAALTLAIPAMGADEPRPAAVTPEATAANRLAQWLCGQDEPAAKSALAVDASAVDVVRSRPMGMGELAGRFQGARVLAVLTYAGAPKTLASDLSQQLKQIEDIAGADLRPLICSNEKTRQADDTAADWMTDVLRIKEGDASGVIILWHAEPIQTASITETAAPQPRLVMIAFKLVSPRSGGAPVVQRIAHVLPAEPAPAR